MSNDAEIPYKIIHARNPQLIPIVNQSGLTYTIGIACQNAESTVELRNKIDPAGNKTRARNKTIYIIQGNESCFSEQFPEIDGIINQSRDNHLANQSSARKRGTP